MKTIYEYVGTLLCPDLFFVRTEFSSQQQNA